MAAKVVSVCNLKGGVGKTTLVMALAEYLASDTIFRSRVLVVDLDPQSNLTYAMMDESIWEQEFESKKRTLPYLFENPINFLDDHNHNEFIVKSGVSNIRNNNSFRCLHLIPSSPRLFEIQDELVPIHFHTLNLKPVHILSHILKPYLKNYDYILIDCPPSLNSVVKSAFLISDFCLVPCVPSKISILGLNLILKHIWKFNDDHKHNLKALGIIISRYNGTLAQKEQLHHILDEPFYPEVFNTKIPEKSKVAESIDFTYTMTHKQKYGDVHEVMKSLAQEFIDKVGK